MADTDGSQDQQNGNGGGTIVTSALIARWVRMLSIFAIAVLLTLFTVQNFLAVQVQFFSWNLRAPIALVIFATFVLGIIVGYLLRYLRIIRVR